MLLQEIVHMNKKLYKSYRLQVSKLRFFIIKILTNLSIPQAICSAGFFERVH